MNRTNWKFGYAIICLFAVFAFDVMYFNDCRCWFGAWERMQRQVAMYVLGFIAARFIVAWLFKEKNEGWKAYLVFAVLSPLVVTIAFGVVSLFLPPELRSHSG
jgi:hypothetical protein